MDSATIYEAIVSLWDANSLDSTFTGGLYYQTHPSDSSFPYVVFEGQGNTTISFTSKNRIIEHSFLMQVYFRDDDANDPVSQVGVLLAALNTVFDEAELSIASSKGDVAQCLAGGDTIAEEEDFVWRGDQEYDIVRTRPRPS